MEEYISDEKIDRIFENASKIQYDNFEDVLELCVAYRELEIETLNLRLKQKMHQAGLIDQEEYDTLIADVLRKHKEGFDAMAQAHLQKVHEDEQRIRDMYKEVMAEIRKASETAEAHQ